jgi:hypothetical protein
MKTLLCAVFLLCTSAAFAQTVSGAISSQVTVFQMPSHPEHATYAPLGREQNLSEHCAYIYAKGERPLWEVAPVKEEVPLGDIARALKEDHQKAPKAEFVKEN